MNVICVSVHNLENYTEVFSKTAPSNTVTTNHIGYYN